MLEAKYTPIIRHCELCHDCAVYRDEPCLEACDHAKAVLELRRLEGLVRARVCGELPEAAFLALAARLLDEDEAVLFTLP